VTPGTRVSPVDRHSGGWLPRLRTQPVSVRPSVTGHGGGKEAAWEATGAIPRENMPPATMAKLKAWP